MENAAYPTFSPETIIRHAQEYGETGRVVMIGFAGPQREST